MRFKPAVAVTIVAALLALAPVVIVVGLGFYGSTLTGEFVRPAEAEGRPFLELSPSGGPPGTVLTVSGRGFPPRQNVEILLRRDPNVRALRLALIQSNRSGRFSTDVALPASILGFGRSNPMVLASTVDRTDVGSRAEAEFDLDLEDSGFSVSVWGAEQQAGVAEAVVVVRDQFGFPAVTTKTDMAGLATIAGLAPGDRYSLEVRKLDYERWEGPPLRAPASGTVSLHVNLQPRSGERVIVSTRIGNQGDWGITVLDGASLLPIHLEAPVQGAWRTLTADVQLGRIFGSEFEGNQIHVVDLATLQYVEALTIDVPRETLSGQYGLLALTSSFVFSGPGPFYTSDTRYSAEGRLLVGATQVDLGDMVTVDVRTGATITHVRVPGGTGAVTYAEKRGVAYLANRIFNFVAAVNLKGSPTEDWAIWRTSANGWPEALALSPDEKFLYVVEFLSGTVAKIDAETGTIAARWKLGGGINRVVIDPTGSWLFASTLEGSQVLKVDAMTGEVVDLTPVAKGPVGLALSGRGDRLFVLSGVERALTVLDSATLRPLETIGLRGRPGRIVSIQRGE